MSGPILGVVLAGGGARRMEGAEKALLRLAGRSLLERVVAAVAPQVDALLLNVNSDPARYAEFGLPMAADSCPGGLGPLAGILTGMEWARREDAKCEWLVSVPVDTPFVPDDLVQRLFGARKSENADIAAVASGGRIHPVVGLWPVAEADALRHALLEEGVRKMDRWTARYRVAVASYEADPEDPFLNINTPADLAAAEALLTN